MKRSVIKQVVERDDNTCQRCGKWGCALHHIVYGGTGCKRNDKVWNIISLCSPDGCHDLAHSCDEVRRWCEDWSRQRYGSKIDELKAKKWSVEK